VPPSQALTARPVGNAHELQAWRLRPLTVAGAAQAGVLPLPAQPFLIPVELPQTGGCGEHQRAAS